MNPTGADFEQILMHLDVACRKAADCRLDVLTPSAARNLAVAVAVGHVPHLKKHDGEGDGHDPESPARVYEYQISGDGFRWQIANLSMTPQRSREIARARLEERISRSYQFIFAAFRPIEPGFSPLEITALFRVTPRAVIEELDRQIAKVKPATTRLNFIITAVQLRRMVAANAATVDETFHRCQS
jgi:hypothetical protein